MKFNQTVVLSKVKAVNFIPITDKQNRKSKILLTIIELARRFPLQ